MINHNLNANEAICIATSDFHAEQKTDTWNGVQALLQKHHKTQFNTAENRPKTEDIKLYGVTQEITDLLATHKIIKISQLITPNNTIINQQKITQLCKPLTTHEYTEIKTRICTKNSDKIHPYILHINDIELPNPTDWLQQTSNYIVNKISYQIIVINGAHLYKNNIAAYT